MSAVPSPGPEHGAALAWAASFRAYRAALCAALADGTQDLPALLGAVTDDAFLSETKLLTVLEALPGARKTDTRRTLEGLGVAPGTRLGALTDEQRSLLLATFPLDRPAPAQEEQPA